MRWVLLLLVGCGFQPVAAHGETDPQDARSDGTIVQPIDAPSDASIPITFIQSGTHQSTGTVTSTSVALTDAQHAGDLVVIAISWVGGASTVAITDTSGNTYTLVGTRTSGSISHAVLYAPNLAARATSNTLTASFSPGLDGPTMRAVEYSGITAAPLDNSATMVGNGNSAGTSVTASHAHDLIYVAETSGNSATGPQSDFTQRLLFLGDLIEDREVMTAGVATADVALNTQTDWVVTVIAFMGAS